MIPLLLIAIVDAKEKRIPNQLLLVLLAGVILHLVWVGNINVIDVILGSSSVSGFLLFIIWLKPQSFGMGDVKLMAVSGLLLGFEKNFAAFAIGIVLAAAFCLAGISLKKMNRKSEIPFGPFLCMGIIVALFLA